MKTLGGRGGKKDRNQLACVQITTDFDLNNTLFPMNSKLMQNWKISQACLRHPFWCLLPIFSTLPRASQLKYSLSSWCSPSQLECYFTQNQYALSQTNLPPS